MKIQIRTSVTNGKLIRNRNLILDAINSYEGKELLITFEKPKKQRSNGQNRFYYGVVLPIVKSCLKNAGHVLSIKQTHDLIKLKFLKETLFINESTGEVVERIKSTTELSTSQFMEFLFEINQFTLEYFNTSIPEPNENLTLNFDE